MKRVLVIGSGGAGKSTFAKRLGEILELKVIHLDSLFWSAGWVEMPKDQWRAMVEELIEGDSWILDGNYGGTLDLRLAACDGVIFLDTPRMICLKRIFKRRLSHRKQSRRDMSLGCPERINWEFIKYIRDYPRTRKPAVLKKIESCSNTKTVAILRSQADIEGFLRKQANSHGRHSNEKISKGEI